MRRMLVRGYFKLDEWDALACMGRVEEPQYSSDSPNTGVGCPGILSPHKRTCGAHLWDFQITVDSGRRRVVGCSVCGWSGDRRISTKPRSKVRLVE